MHDVQLEKFSVHVKSWLRLNCLRFASQTENGKLGDHEHSSTMEHLRLLLHMVLSMARTHADATTTTTTTAVAAAAGVGEWQEDSGLGLYRAPEEGAGAGAGAAASVHPVSLEKKVSPGWVERCFLLAASVVKGGSKWLFPNR